MMKKIFFLFFISVFVSSAFAQTTKVLFLGNSLTSFQPSVFRELAQEAGFDVLVESNIMFGKSLEQVLASQTTLDYIAQENWDYVVLQGSSYAIAFPEYHRLLYPTYSEFNNIILDNYSESKIVLFMDWTSSYGADLNEIHYTADELIIILREGTMLFADKYDFIVSPIGEAFYHVLKNYPEINCLSSDDVHPSGEGSYLAGCVYFYTILGATQNEHFNYTGNLETETAYLLQDVAEEIVMTNYNYWRNIVDTMATDAKPLENEFLSLNLFPNPANEKITVEIANDVGQKYNLSVFDACGKKVISKNQINRNKFEIDISGLNEGIYICEIKSDKMIVRKKILKRN